MLTLLTTQLVFAQNSASIKGYIAGYNQQPLASATVSLFDAYDSSLVRTVITKENGSFEFQNLPDGIYYTSYTSVGYEPGQGKRFILSNSLKYCCDSVILFPGKKQLAAVTIEGKKPSFIEARADKMVVNVENSSSAAGSTVFEVLEKSPGIYTDKNGNLSMQGKSGAQIMIDGRPTNLSGAEVTTLLKNMQSSDVQSIELITNPSAKYDASGNAGIINIKTKKNKSYGTSGTVTAGAGYGNHSKANGGLSLNNRSKKMNLFANYNYSYNQTGRSLAIDRVTVQDGVQTIFAQDGAQHEKNNNRNMKLGTDYNINKNNVIGFLYNGYDNKEDQNADNITLMSKQKGVADSSLYADNRFDMRYKNSSYNLNYKSKLNGNTKELSIDADYAKYNATVNSFFKNNFYDGYMKEMKSPSNSKNNTHSIINIYSLKADYSNQVTESLKMEAGAKATWISTDNDLIYSNLAGSEWQKDYSKSNHFQYNENVLAAYVNTAKNWKNTSLQAGIRAEYSDTKGNSITDNKVVKRDYIDFFPSIFLNQTLSSRHKIGASYSKRIQRPNYESLNPFVYIIDEYTYQKGNPFLNPQYTNSFEISYFYNNKYLVQAGYSSTRDVITEVILADTAKKALYQTDENIDHQKMYRITVGAPLQITKWWKTNNNFSGIEMDFSSQDLKGQRLKTAQFFAMLSTSNNFKIYKDLTGELNGKYTSPLVYGTLKLRSEFSVDAGISKSLLNKKGNLKLAATDILNTKNQKVSSVYPGVNYALRQKYETRVFRLSFTYRFGNSNLKESRHKPTGLEDEQSRLKSTEVK